MKNTTIQRVTYSRNSIIDSHPEEADNLLAVGDEPNEPKRSVSEIHSCFFDNESVCNYTQPLNSSSKWYRLLANGIHEDYSMQLIIGSLNAPGSQAAMISPFIQVHHFACFKFFVKLEAVLHEDRRKDSIGELRVLLERPSGSRLLLYKETQSHGQYMDEIVVPFKFSGRIRLIFQMFIGTAIASRVAIDSVRVLNNTEVCNKPVCPKGTFDCGGGLCRPWTAWCNGIQECPNNIDEQAQCDSICPPDWFLCKDTLPLQCVDQKQVCDSEFNCVNGEDETYCKCDENQLRCDDGLCLPIELFCNGHQDCDDFSDEKYNCTCPLRQFKPRLLCDGIHDCQDRSDETLCNRCTSTEFACFNSGYRCVPNEAVCDGVMDCSLGEDETDCFKLWNPATPTIAEYILPQEGYITVKKANVQSFVCMKKEQTNINYFTGICSSMGYGELLFVTPEGIHPKMTSFVTFDNYTTKISILGQMSNIKTCAMFKVYYLKCRSAVCGLSLTNKALPVSILFAHSHPWHVAIFKVYPHSFKKPIKFLCGGSLINNEWIITAAHCVFGSSTLLVTAGSSRRSATTSRDIHKMVDRVVLHPLYDARSMQHDLALIKLVNHFEWGRTVRPICFNSKNVDNCRVVGWGAEIRGGTNRNNLREVKMEVVSQSQCESAAFVHRYVNKSGIFCASPKSQGLCEGDSGGGLICSSSHGKTREMNLAGIVTYSTDPCTHRPVAFTNISFYKPWILQQIL